MLYMSDLRPTLSKVNSGKNIIHSALFQRKERMEKSLKNTRAKANQQSKNAGDGCGLLVFLRVIFPSRSKALSTMRTLSYSGNVFMNVGSHRFM